MRQIFIKSFVVLILGHLLSSSACTKVVTYANIVTTEPIEKSYNTSLAVAMEKSQKALESLGYEIVRVEESQNQIVTGWRPTLSNSHYLTLFKRPDYSANAGSYYQIVADISADGNRIKVAVYTNVKSVAGNLTSSKVVENKFFERLGDFLRSPQIDITNVGMTER